MIVVDTNVMIHLLLDGPDSLDASELLQRDDVWAAPPILLSELRNTLLGSVRRGTIVLNEAVELSSDAVAILGDRMTSVGSEQVLDVAIECDLTAYDAEFVALARTLDAPLVTLDGGILDGAPDVAVRPRAFLDAS